MIQLLFTLHGDNGEIEHQEVENVDLLVPRVGELVSFDPHRSYQVIDVLWHLGGDPYVSITACQRNWHAHIAQVQEEWANVNRGV
ncbi:hypothetical protein [Lentzea sp. CA-135723]|uniref:hypothetical protein n=1 Tax=Lentzea sp. CA-135723 TaxID=3239950 RepID=UPI003D92A2D8